jgi:hypothetical protein
VADRARPLPEAREASLVRVRIDAGRGRITRATIFLSTSAAHKGGARAGIETRQHHGFWCWNPMARPVSANSWPATTDRDTIDDCVTAAISAPHRYRHRRSPTIRDPGRRPGPPRSNGALGAVDLILDLCGRPRALCVFAAGAHAAGHRRRCHVLGSLSARARRQAGRPAPLLSHLAADDSGESEGHR